MAGGDDLQLEFNKAIKIISDWGMLFNTVADESTV